MTSDARQRMVEAAAVLLAQRGLQGASFSEVIASSGAPRGSIYHHFPEGKDQLVLAALEVAGARAKGLLEAVRGRPAQEVAQRFADLWRSVLTASNLRAGCAVLAVTVAADSPALLDRAGEVFREWQDLIADLLLEGGVPAERAPTLAALLVAGCEGAVALARAQTDVAVFDRVADELVTAIRLAA
jgi:TetR/AcrR family transcriptional regulator, lmrAB and yxaGH operons repressor